MYSSYLKSYSQFVLFATVFVCLFARACNGRTSESLDWFGLGDPEFASFNGRFPTLSDLKRLFFELGENLAERIELLGSVTQHSSRKFLNRPFLSYANRKAANLIKGWLEEAGCCNIFIDLVGNVAGVYKGSSRTGKTLIIGSHYDTVNNGGKYDGVYGILVAVGVVQVLCKLQIRLPFDVQIVAFENEEGNNDFGLVHTGSLFYVAGSAAKRNGARRKCSRMLKSQLFTKSSVHPNQCLADYILENTPYKGQGTPNSYKSLLNYFCHEYPLAVENEVLGYWEWHIEQGPILDISRKRVGIVSAICGQERWSFAVVGKGGHAGTVPMLERKDAFAACVEMIQQVEEITKGIVSSTNGTTFLVATVGNISIAPGSSNVIPHLCSFTLDIRSASDSLLVFATSQITRKMEEIAKRRKVKLNKKQWHRARKVEMNSGEMQEAIKYGAYISNLFEWKTNWKTKFLRMSDSAERSVPMLVSGAGHDAVVLQQLYDVNMAFIRCREGISHQPNEHASKQDMLAGAITLFFSLMALANSTRQ